MVDTARETVQVQVEVGNEVTLRVEEGGLLETPIWQEDEPTKNWLARIWRDKDKPGGFGREFAPHTQPPVRFYIEDTLYEGCAVEFGAARASDANRPWEKDRWYGVITRMADTALVVRRYNTGHRACKDSVVAP